MKRSQTVRIIFVVSIMLIIAAIHAFRLGSYLEGDLYILFYSYASDLILPFGAYFLLSINEIHLPWIRKRYVKAALAFFVMTFSEVLQFFDIYFFGVTFDLIDIFMYGIGALAAALVDRQFLARLIPNWRYE